MEDNHRHCKEVCFEVEEKLVVMINVDEVHDSIIRKMLRISIIWACINNRRDVCDGKISVMLKGRGSS